MTKEKNPRESWRYVWQQAIEAGQKAILDKSKSIDYYFNPLYENFGNDRMITFEKAICLECRGEKEKARILYEQSQNVNISPEDGQLIGLPVEH